MTLIDRIHVVPRYQRAIRIDTDFSDPTTVEGFVCPESSVKTLETMVRHIDESGQGAFTWTGPYGSGKSSLAVVFCAALSRDRKLKRSVASVLGKETLTRITNVLPLRTKGWHVLPIVGRRGCPSQAIGEALQSSGLLNQGKRRKSWTEKGVLDAFEKILTRNSRTTGGVAVFVDEMGKFLEAAAYDGYDVHIFQQMAELASRSKKRLIFVGILHQAFEEYALSREMRDEWFKIHGRFVDLVVHAAEDEKINLLGRAIQSNHNPVPPSALSRGVAKFVQGKESTDFAIMLENCWPLHPIVACLLSSVSGRRFGQNQRSIFGFLNTAEPFGFRDFLRTAGDDDIYRPDQVWDYLKLNLESSILASPDGHRWALAVDALARCEDMGGESLHIRLLKVIAILDLFKNRLGLEAKPDLLKLALSEYSAKELKAALADLQKWSLIVFRKFTDAYAIFAGSDFDIDQAVKEALGSMGQAEFASVNTLASLQPIVAKRHYHDTGTLRWFDIDIVPLAEVVNIVAEYTPCNGAIGGFFLAIPTEGESKKIAHQICRKAVREDRNWDIVLGLSQSAWSIPALSSELSALERVRDEASALQGDKVARIEIRARIVSLKDRLESELIRAFNNASWYQKRKWPKPLLYAEINSLASDLADARYDQAPKLHNELLNRTKPSSSAAAAQKALFRHMAKDQGKPRLGIEGFPAERGLYESLLEATRLYRKTKDGPRIVEPDVNNIRNLMPTWQSAKDLLKKNAHRVVPVTEIHEIWQQAPFGIKKGLLPFLTVAFLFSQQKVLALYREGLFQSRVSDVDIERLIKNPSDIQLRWMELSDTSRWLLSELADVVRDIDHANELHNLEPLDVARGLVAIYDHLPPWVGRTQHLSRNAKRVRQMFKRANDPNKLIFDDIPKLSNQKRNGNKKRFIEKIVSQVREGLLELQQVYPAMLSRMREMLLAELRVPNTSPAMIAELQSRARNIQGLGDDYRLESFITRLIQFEGHDESIESIAGMAINKSPRDWVDSDIDRATIRLAEMAQKFLLVETYARVKGRQAKRHAMAVVVSMDGRPTPVHDEFDVADLDRARVESLLERMNTTLKNSGERQRNIILAALAELIAKSLKSAHSAEIKADDKKKRAIS